MPLTESIMLFYREAFPMSYQFAGCALIWQQMATMEVSCPMKNGRVSKLNIEGWLSRTRSPFLLLPSSQDELFCSLADGSVVLFFSPPRSPTRRLTKYLM